MKPTYTLAIANEHKPHLKPKHITKRATAKNLEQMLQMAHKLRYAKTPMIAFIFKCQKGQYIDIAYITNLKYSKQ